MADESAPSSPALTAKTRARLERMAFAKPATARDELAAAKALRRLIEADEAERLAKSAPSSRAHPETVILAEPAPERSDFDQSPRASAPVARWRIRLVPILIIVGLIVGLGFGVAAARSSPTLFAAGSAPKPRASGALFSAFDPNAVSVTAGSGDVQAAEQAVDAPQVAGDVLPAQAQPSRLGILPTSVHRVLSTPDGLTLWIGRTPTDLCLIYTGGTGNFGGAANCVSPSEFTQTGLVLQAEQELWSWNGNSFTVAITG